MSVNKVAQKWEPKYHGEGKNVREGKRSRSVGWGVGTVGKCIENSNGVGKDIKLIKVQNTISTFQELMATRQNKIEFPN